MARQYLSLKFITSPNVDNLLPITGNGNENHSKALEVPQPTGPSGNGDVAPSALSCAPLQEP